VPALAAALALLAIGAVIGATMMTRSGAEPSPTPAEIRGVHATLHLIDRRCTGGRASMAREARMLAGFARRYPRARFLIDGENARTDSLLLVARHAFLSCDPRSAIVVERAYQTGPMRPVRVGGPPSTAR